MKYQEFENGLSGKFHNAQEHVDISALILNLKERKPKKDRKGFLWLFFIAAAMAIGYAGIQQLESNPFQSNPKNFQATIFNNNTKESNQEKDFSVQETKSNSEDQFQSDRIASEIASPTRILEKSEKTKTQEVINNNSKSLETDRKSIGKIIQTDRSSHNSSTIIEREKQISSTLEANIEDALVINKGIENINTLTTITPLPLSLQNEINPDLIACPTFRKRRWAIDIIPEIGIIAPFKNLTRNSVEPNPIYDMRAMDERSLEGLMAALYMRVRPVQKPLNLKFGISYTRLSERMNLNTTWTQRDTTVGIISITQSQSGDTITTIYGDIITETEHFRKSTDHYYLHLIDIPISLGYSKSIGKNWRLGAEAGVQVNLSLRSSGKLLEGSGENSFTKLPAEGRFRTRLGVSYFGGLSLEKTISSRMAFYISPRVRFFNAKVTPESYGIGQNYVLAGIHSGFVYTIR